MTQKKPISKLNFKTAREWHIHYVFSDPEFIQEISSTPIDENGWPNQQIVDGLAQKYFVPVDELLFHFFEDADSAHKISSRLETVSLQYSLTSQSFTLSIPNNITYEQFVQSWPMIIDTQKQLTLHKGKRKPPTNHELIYAIFKAILRGDSKDKIFKNYNEGLLAGYKGATHQFDTKKELFDYFRRYDPRR